LAVGRVGKKGSKLVEMRVSKTAWKSGWKKAEPRALRLAEQLDLLKGNSKEARWVDWWVDWRGDLWA